VSTGNEQQLPHGWELCALPDIAQINPPLDRCIVSDDVEIDFVPMRAVDPEGGGLRRPEVSTYGRVKKGYTPFIAGDVIMAKITPCMENGKTCVVPNLAGVACFGSTEFHVIRAETGIDARWISYFLLQRSTRHLAQRQMMGGVGQMRVPSVFLESLKIPVSPSQEQQRTLEELDELLSDLDAGVATLERVRVKLKHYRAAVLKSAVDGTLTAEWRAQHPPIEPATELLKRILAERRLRWEESQLQKFEESGKEPPKNWKAKYHEPAAPDSLKLRKLPDGWCWTSVEQLSFLRSGQTPAGMPRVSENEGDYQWFRVADMNAQGNENWMVEGGVRLRKQTVRTLGLNLMPAGSIIFPKRGGAIATNKKRILRFESACDLNLMAVSPMPPVASYLWIVFRHLDLARLSDGSNVPQINNPDIAPLMVALPPRAEQAAVVDAVEDQLSVIDHLEADIEANLKNAEALRQSILRHAFEGKLVSQNPNDEPASELLKRIAVEREERAREILASKKTKAKPKTVRKKPAKS
jgi:type I restriction enzyme, S subunit